MNGPTPIKAPNKTEKVVLRTMIVLGAITILNFFYWFMDFDAIDDHLLFWLLMSLLIFDSLRMIYIWYHYWDISIPNRPVPTKSLTVDILTTYFPGEPYEMVKETLLAIQRMEYPHTTYLCDEANDSHLKDFCKKNNIRHVTRNNRIDAKAGNINNALLQATGDVCLILDPDHIPKKDFLEGIMPYFEDSSIGFVQTVQAYYNVGESLVAKGAAEQTFHFYGPVMMSMNSYGTVNAIGANCVFRREALDSIGGHAAGLSEDMHTAMQLHAKGWKSLYVPAIYTNGLVPASLTGYYKQQLKWSRGTLELLVSVYPKLFKDFSWRQKVHYGILPFHYLSGIFYLISFLIPIISLFTATTPWKGNVVNFALLFTPIFTCILGIRFYIQKWVMRRSERGIHLMGGFLLTCTWWIYILGFIYTVIRKKVPYLPTPKEDKELTNWKILLPNILMGLISIIAVIYGLSIDFTPFSIVMSGFALLNAFFMGYTVVFAYQAQKNVAPPLEEGPENIPSKVSFKDRAFQGWRKLALPVVVFVLFICGFLQYYSGYLKWGGVKSDVQTKNVINYLGIFAPENDNGITTLKKVHEISGQLDENFDIISLYLPWDKQLEASFPQTLLDSIYMRRSIPLITWEPWLNTFQEDLNDNDHVYQLIEDGYFDSFISRFATKLKNLERPVFLRFAHEFDNPFYPWYIKDDQAPQKFKKAWVHTYELFKKNGAHNVVWIWNPWKAENVEPYYPGEEYVDWIGVNALNYGPIIGKEKWFDFKGIYQPFHEEFQKLPAAPIIISEFGTLKGDHKQEEWLNSSFKAIEEEFNEIKSVVYFNSKVDNNWPAGAASNANLDWTVPNRVIKNSFKGKEIPKYVVSPLPNIHNDSLKPWPSLAGKLKAAKGINLKKGQDWRKDYHVLSRKNLLKHFEGIRQLGIGTIKVEGNSVYDYNILNVAKEFDIKVSYGFWVPADMDFILDSQEADQLKSTILKNIRKYKNSPTISSWNIQNDVLYNQKDFYHKPELLYQNRAYILWLKKLVQGIKEIDPSRPIIVDLEVDSESLYHSKMLRENIPGMDALGLVVKDAALLDPLLKYLERTKTAHIYSEVPVEVFTERNLANSKGAFFITSWQDMHESNKLTFDGIIDRKGRYKDQYFELRHAIRKTNIPAAPPTVRILKPSKLIYKNKIYSFHAMVYDPEEGWVRARKIKDLEYEWSLVKCDEFGNFLAIKDLEKGPTIKLDIPEDPELYRLLLTVTKGQTTTTTITPLNTPLPPNTRL